MNINEPHRVGLAATAGLALAVVLFGVGLAHKQYQEAQPMKERFQYMENGTKTLCIGGPLDGQFAPRNDVDTFGTAAPFNMSVTYTRQGITIDGARVLYFYTSDDITITAAVHMVFARYMKKGK